MHHRRGTRLPNRRAASGQRAGAGRDSRCRSTAKPSSSRSGSAASFRDQDQPVGHRHNGRGPGLPRRSTTSEACFWFRWWISEEWAIDRFESSWRAQTRGDDEGAAIEASPVATPARGDRTTGSPGEALCMERVLHSHEDMTPEDAALSPCSAREPMSGASSARMVSASTAARPTPDR